MSEVQSLILRLEIDVMFGVDLRAFLYFAQKRKNSA